MKEHTVWVEKYRPKRVEDCILPKELKEIFLGILKSGTIPNLLLSGPHGLGKTTVAKALCEQLDCDYIYINASDDRGINMVRDTIPQHASSIALGGKRKMIILDEADNLTSDAQDALRGSIERFSKNCGVIATVNHKNKIKPQIQSRFSHVDFKIPSAEKLDILSDFIKACLRILDEEKVEYNKKAVMQVVATFFPDFRRTIHELQKYSKRANKIDEGILVHNLDSNMSGLFKALKAGNYQQIRTWVVENLDNDSQLLFDKLYEALDKYMVQKSIPQAILHIGTYMFRSSSVGNQEVNFLCCLTEIVRDCEFV